MCYFPASNKTLRDYTKYLSRINITQYFLTSKCNSLNGHAHNSSSSGNHLASMMTSRKRPTRTIAHFI